MINHALILSLKIFTILTFLCFGSSPRMCAQGSAGSNAKIEPRYIIDLSTAGMLRHGDLAIDMDFFQSGGLLVGFSLGAFNRFTIGMSYGGENIVGSEDPHRNGTPGFQVRLRLIDESLLLPAIVLGFNSQGKEVYVDSLSRYNIKSMGFYLVGSKNYRAMGFLSLHGGVNYSLERSDGDSDPNIFAGLEKTFGPFLSLLGEYNLALNDNDGEALGKGRGYLNVGFRVSIGGGFTFGMNVKDIFKNQRNNDTRNRTLSLEYVKML